MYIVAMLCSLSSISTTTAAQVGDGALIYQRMCAICHGDEGEGHEAEGAPALANQDFLVLANDAFLFEAISRGRPDTAMSAWHADAGGPLSNDDIGSLIAFIRAWQKESSINVDDMQIEGDPVQGEPLYEEHCRRCHGPGLDEVAAPSLRDPVFLETASDGFLYHSILRGRRGTSMPAFREALTAGQIADLVALIRSRGTEQMAR